MKQALGLVEIAGLCTAVTAADAMVKAANVELVELEPAKGGGYMTIKIVGDVGAVNAAVMAGRQVGTENQKLVAWKVIPRPSDSVEDAFVKHGEKRKAEDGKKESGEQKAEGSAENGPEAGDGRPREAEAAERESAERKTPEDGGAKAASHENEDSEREAVKPEKAEHKAAEPAPGREPEEAKIQEAEDDLMENPPEEGEGTSEDGAPKPKRPSRRTARKKETKSEKTE